MTTPPPNKRQETWREKIDELVDEAKEEFEESWGVHNRGSFEAEDTEVWLKRELESLIAQAVKEERLKLASMLINEHSTDITPNGSRVVYVTQIQQVIAALTPRNGGKDGK